MPAIILGNPTGGSTIPLVSEASPITQSTSYTLPGVKKSVEIPITVNLHHGSLTGLTGDDHPLLHNDVRGDIRYYTKTDLAADAAAAPVHWNNITNFLVDSVSEKTSDVGVTIDDVLLKDGMIMIKEHAAPDAPATGYGMIYLDSSDSKLKFKNDAGTIYILSSIA